MMELKGKKVLVVGLGKSGLAAALFLRRRGAQVTVSDIRSAEALANDIPSLLEEGINVEAGGHGLLTFRRQDLIVVSPGVPLDTPELAQVRSFGLPVIGELELAARFLKGRILAITGSNGALFKSMNKTRRVLSRFRLASPIVPPSMLQICPMEKSSRARRTSRKNRSY